MAGNSPKIGRGKRQPARAAYKNTNRDQVNAKKRKANREAWLKEKHSDANFSRGAKRRARRAEWMIECPKNELGKPSLSFQKWEASK